ncbi:MAG TPA: transporter [Stenotrophomonas sp.]|jgi:hypothetical protein
MKYRPDSRSHRLPAAVLAATLLSALGALPAQATEGAMGRSITGLQITSYVGIVPPDPGMQWSLAYVHYDGKIGASRPAPIAGQVSLGLEAEVDMYVATGVYVWPTGEGRWNFASMLTAPWINVDATASLQVGPAQRQVTQSASDWFDLYFAPVIASYHISQVEHVSIGLYVYAPTAKYDPDRLANPGMNIWTVSPAVGYTRMFQKGTLEMSLLGGVDFSSRNSDTDYKNAPVWRLDALLVKRTASGWGFGAVGGWIQQIGDDSGPTADRLNGFQGRSFGLGPVITYGKKWSGGEHLDLSLRYVDEFDVKNRFKGEPLNLSASFGF